MLQALCLIGAAPQDGHIASVIANRSGNGVELVVQGENLAKPHVFQYLNGTVSVVEFDADMDGNGTQGDVNFGGVKSFRSFWYSSSPAKVRINVRLNGSTEPLVTKSATGWTLAFGDVKKATPVMAIKPVTPKVEPFPDKLPAPTKPIRDFKADDRITIDFVNTDIIQVLKAIAMQSGVNIVSTPDLKMSITVSLKDVTAAEALQLVTGLAGLSYVKVDAAYVVAPKDKIAQVERQVRGLPDPVTPVPMAPHIVSQSYLVRGGLASDLVKAIGADAIKGNLGDVTLRATPASSISRQTIVLTGPQDEVNDLMDTLKLMDSADEATAQFEMYDIKFLDPRSARESLLAAVPGLRVTLAPGPAGNPRLYQQQELLSQGRQGQQTTSSQVGGSGEVQSGGQSQQGGAQGVQSSDIKVSSGETAQLSGLSLPFDSFERVAYPMRLVLRGTPDQLKAATDYMSATDIQPKQVAIELRAMELTKEEAEKIGLDWSILSGSGIVRMLRFNEGFGGTGDAAGEVSSTFKGGSVVGMLDTLSDARHLIARPNVLALDGREAEVFVGDVIRYIKSIQSNQNGVTVVTDELRVGVRLAVMPRAGADGNIALDLRPTVSYLSSFTPVPGGGQLPQTSERTTQSSAVIKSGETIALGGLIQDIDRTEDKGIPFLKDLPIIGALFKRKDKSRNRTEIVFFLTAKVVDGTNIASAAIPQPDTTPVKKK